MSAAGSGPDHSASNTLSDCGFQSVLRHMRGTTVALDHVRERISPHRAGRVRPMIIYRIRLHRRICIALAALVTFVATLTLLWVDAGGVS